MSADDDEDGGGAVPPVLAFPYSKVSPAHGDFDAGAPPIYGALAAEIGAPLEQTTGHWCSRCRKIWFGYLLEVACPLCGNRQG